MNGDGQLRLEVFYVALRVHHRTVRATSLHCIMWWVSFGVPMEQMEEQASMLIDRGIPNETGTNKSIKVWEAASGLLLVNNGAEEERKDVNSRRSRVEEEKKSQTANLHSVYEQ